VPEIVVEDAGSQLHEQMNCHAAILGLPSLDGILR
jgi:hypothetical protein